MYDTDPDAWIPLELSCKARASVTPNGFWITSRHSCILTRRRGREKDPKNTSSWSSFSDFHLAIPNREGSQDMYCLVEHIGIQNTPGRQQAGSAIQSSRDSHESLDGKNIDFAAKYNCVLILAPLIFLQCENGVISFDFLDQFLWLRKPRYQFLCCGALN